MKSFLIAVFCILFCSPFSFGMSRETFYKAFSSESLAEINETIQLLKTEKQTSKCNAYQAALLMKKASLVPTPIEKLNNFKKGAHSLEKEINEDKNNTEFRFLRLVIQEKAPAFLGYNKNIKEDKTKIIQNFSQLDPFLQGYIKGYCEKSKVLKISDLKK